MTDIYTIISGTNRKISKTLQVAKQYQQIFKQKEIDAGLLSLEDWTYLERTPAYEKLEKEILIPTTKYILVAPEYNGSIPGILKVLIDISEYRSVWNGKKALLVGVSTGRAGNLRGMEHLTGILHYLDVVVYPNKLPISTVDKLLGPEGTIIDKATIEAIEKQINGFIKF